MVNRIPLSEQGLSGVLLISSSAIFFVAAMLFTGRVIWKWPAGQTVAYLAWERGLVTTAILVALLGFLLLDRLMEAAGSRVLAPFGLLLFLVAAVLTAVEESYFINKQEMLYGMVVVFVVLTFLGEALLGAAIIHSGFLPAWVGWATIIWNLGWLVILPVAMPRDIYFPWLFYVAPLLIGIMLLRKG